MFTGIIAATGTVRSMRTSGGSARLTIDAGAFLLGVGRGGSIAVNGVCLTATELTAASFEADLSAETLGRTTLGGLRPGDTVNLEHPLAAGDRMGGHLVQGHVDGVGQIAGRWREGDAWWIEVQAPPAVARYVVEKGSIAVDGVSLTIAAVAGDRFTVCLIPHTCAATTLGEARPGAGVNLEVDIVAKYVERFTTPYAAEEQGGHR
jgi:riboflavin synthase